MGYEALKADLLACDAIPLAEYEWATRPQGNHGVFQPDFDVSRDGGDDFHQGLIREGSLDVYTQGPKPQIWAALEAILDEHCEASWHMNLEEIDQVTKLLRREYIFQIVEE